MPLWYNPRMETKRATPKFVRWAVMLGIAIVLFIFFVALSVVIFPAPKYEDFCKPISPPTPALGGPATKGTSATVKATPAPQVQTDSVDYYTQCQKPYNDAQLKYSQNVFILLVGLGVLSIIVGVLPLGSSIVSAGLSYGGVLALVIGTGQYWSSAGNLLRLAIAFAALAALLFIGLKRFRD
jgi:hypothetical protein